MTRLVALAAAAAAALAVRPKGFVKALVAAFGTYGALRVLLSLSRAVLGLEREKSPCEIWVEQREENAVEPELRIFDPHHHFFDFVNHHTPGFTNPIMRIIARMKPAVVNELMGADKKLTLCFGKRLPLCGGYKVKELLKDMRGTAAGGHNIVGSMFMECGWQTPGVEKCMEPAGEVDMVEAVHRAHPGICQAMVAHANLSLGKAVEPLLKRYGSNNFVKGIRHSLWKPTKDANMHLNGHAPDPNDMGTFKEGFALLSKYGLTYDSWLSHDSLDTLIDLAASFPETTIICDHIGFPLGIGEYKLEESTPVWKERMAALAKHKNVHVKLGGLGMKFLGFGHEDRDMPPSSDELASLWGPYVIYCIEQFGVDRCMMESNFPMDKITCSYTILFNALKKTVKNYSQEDKIKLFETTALKVYGVKLDA